MRPKTHVSFMLVLSAMFGSGLAFFIRELTHISDTVLKDVSLLQYYPQVLCIQALALILFFRGTIKAFPTFLLCLTSGTMPTFSMGIWVYYNSSTKILLNDINSLIMIALVGTSFFQFFIWQYLIKRKRFKPKYVAQEQSMEVQSKPVRAKGKRQ